MKILITGAKGQLGQELVKQFSQDYEVVAKDLDELDITQKQDVMDLFENEKPAWVIHCAAWTNVEAAAKDPAAAFAVNEIGTRNICEAADQVAAKVVYISTNEVFPGEKKEGYTEDEPTGPINPYAKSKLAGEQACREVLGESCVIARTSWLYGPASQNNFPNKILARAAQQGFLKVTADEFATPTYAPDLAKALKELVKKDVSGVYHLVNEGSASRHEWAREIIKEKGLKVPVEPIKLSDFERASTPPPNAVLLNTKAKSLGIVLRDWKLANKEYLQKI
jgi:dTDP-4-dehydrorhamnose reductase